QSTWSGEGRVKSSSEGRVDQSAAGCVLGDRSRIGGVRHKEVAARKRDRRREGQTANQCRRAPTCDPDRLYRNRLPLDPPVNTYTLLPEANTDTGVFKPLMSEAFNAAPVRASYSPIAPPFPAPLVATNRSDPDAETEIGEANR